MRPGCHLCDVAVEELRRHLDGAGLVGVEVEEVDIEQDDELHRQHLERIPVIRIGDDEICHFAFDPVAFDTALGNRPGGRA